MGYQTISIHIHYCFFTLCNGLNKYHAALPTYNYKQTTDIENATNNIRKR